MTGKIKIYEELAANAHVALNLMQYDGWLLRFSEGHTCRANSVSVIYPSSIDLEEKVEYCEKKYAEQNLPCIFKLTDGDDELLELLQKRCYEEVTPTDVLEVEIGDVKMPEDDFDFYDKHDEEWLIEYFFLENYKEKNKKIYRKMLDKGLVDTQYVALKENGKVVAVASSATERDHMLIRGVFVDPDYRRKGYGRKVCLALMAKASECGTKTAWLQVLCDNKPAYDLYEKLGFRKVYGYLYMKK